MNKVGSSFETIFVSVVNYRDTEGQFTIIDLFEKAAFPQQVHIGYCLQYDPDEDSQECMYALNQFKASGKPGCNNIRSIFLPYHEAKGPMYARSIVEQRLLDDEKYFLQIDCHMRFIQNWDKILIEMINNDVLCQACKYPIITTYPNSFDTSDDMTDLDYRPAILCAKHFDSNKDGMLRICAKQFVPSMLSDDSNTDCKTDSKHQEKDTSNGNSDSNSDSNMNCNTLTLPSLFYAAGFSFCFSKLILVSPNLGEELPYVFFGEETIMALKYFCHGAKFFCPKQVICFHKWKRSERQHNWRQIFNQKLQNEEMKSIKTIEKYLKGEIKFDNCKLTIQDFQQYCGVNFQNKEISFKAKFGGIEKEQQECFVENIRKKQMSKLLPFLFN